MRATMIPSEWLEPGAVLPVTAETVATLLAAVKACTFTQGRAAGLEEERAAFEAWVTEGDDDPFMKQRAIARGNTGQYLLMQTAVAWNVWQARAALSPISSDAGKDDARDAERLDFMADYQAWISRSRDGDVFSVWRRDDEGNSVPIMGYPQKCFDSPRAAIDAALSSLEVIGKGEKG